MVCQVWLEIGDGSEPERDDAGLELTLRWQVQEHTGTSKLVLKSPWTPALSELTRAYVRDYRSWRPRERDRALTAERSLLTAGRSLGNGLVDAEYRLLTFCEWLERAGVGALHVAVRSDRPAVHELPWELLILPDSPYVLAAASAAFVRAPAAFSPFEVAAQQLGLSGAAGRPLGYLQLVQDAAPLRQSLSLLWAQTSWQGAVRAQLVPSPRHPQGLPEAGDQAWHVVHWSGLVTERDGALQLQLGGGSPLSTGTFVERVRALGAQLLILEPALYSGAMHVVARAALDAGIDNVLVLSEPSDGVPSRWVDALFECIGSGLSLSRAVVETRKRMQRAFLAARQAEVEQPHAAEQWHALKHYSTRDVVFFDGPQSMAGDGSQPAAVLSGMQPAPDAQVALRASLFGFDAQHLPPHAVDLGDAAAFSMMRPLRSQAGVLVQAVRGAGLTHALHRTALLLRSNGDVQRAYYWDFEREVFTHADVIEMVAGARGETSAAQVSEERVLASLRLEPQLFVFDNVQALCADATTPARDHAAQFFDLVARLAQAGGLCLLGTHTALPEVSALASFARIELAPLTEAECVTLLQVAEPQAFATGSTLPLLLAELQGNPLLLRRAFHGATTETAESALREARQHYGIQVEPAAQVARFHACRFQQLEPCWQRLLLAWRPLGPLYWQLLMIAVDRPGGERSESGRALWTALDAPAAVSCGAAIARLQQAGFVVAGAAGSIVDRSAHGFLEARSEPSLPSGVDALLAQLLCEGVLRLLERREPPQPLLHHLLSMRELLCREIDVTLQSGRAVLAVRTFLRLHELWLRAKLTQEAGARARALLELGGPELATVTQAEQASAWLGIALRAEVQPLSGALEVGVRHWHAALQDGALQVDVGRRALLPVVVALLERVYDQTGDVDAYRAVARLACDHHRAHGDTLALVPQLRALAAAEHVLGQADARDRIEAELVSGIAYGESQAGLQLRRHTLAQLAATRLRRADEPGATALIALLEQEWDGQALNVPALSLRAELALRHEHWELATEQYCALWRAALAGAQGIDVDLVARRLQQLEPRVGLERFAGLYAQHAGETPTPQALGLRPDEAPQPG